MYDMCTVYLTISGGVSQHFVHLLVGGVLSQSAHDVSDLVVSHLVVTHSVKQTEGLSVVCREEGEEESSMLVNLMNLMFSLGKYVIHNP